MYVNVIPLIRSIRGKDSFTYSLEERIKGGVVRGQLVQIPWRSKFVTGVVHEIDVVKPTFATKPIKKLLDVSLDSMYMDFIEWIAEYYCIALSHAAKLSIPEAPKKKYALNKDETNMRDVRTLTVSRNRISVVQKTFQSLRESHESQTVLYQKYPEVVALISGYAKNGSVAIIVPEESYIDELRGHLHSYAPHIITSHLNKTEMYSLWKSAVQSEATAYIGTKRLAFFPLHAFDTICIIDPEDQSHKQWDGNPRYHTQTIAEAWRELSASHVVYFSQAPRLDQFASVEMNMNLLSEDLLPDMRIIDLSDNHFYSKDIPLTLQIVERCREASVVFLWLNKKSGYDYLVCDDCGTLSEDASITVCSSCGGKNMQSRGYGTTRLAAGLAELFPDRPIIELTKDSEIIAIEYDKNPIIIGTRYADSRVQWQRVDYQVIVATDYLLSQPEFRSAELALQQFIRIRNRCVRLDVQTYSPEHPVIKALGQLFAKSWYENELQLRERFKLPPAHFRAEIRHRDTAEQRVITELDQLPDNPDWLVDREI